MSFHFEFGKLHVKNDNVLYVYISYRNSKQWAILEICWCIFFLNKKDENGQEIKQYKRNLQEFI
jgi:hypothetical protein